VDALERLRSANLLGFAEKQGYTIQSSAGQAWQRERDDFGVTQEQVSAEVQEALGILMAEPDRPRLAGRPFPWKVLYSDGRVAEDVLIGTDGAITVDFRNIGAEERHSSSWATRSDDEAVRNHLLWVVGDEGQLEDVARSLGQARAMVRRFQPRRSSLTSDRQRLLLEEEAGIEGLEDRLRRTVAKAFLHGTMYFRGQSIVPRDEGRSFSAAIHAAGSRLLPVIYDRSSDIAVSETELGQLLARVLAGPSMKFFEKGLGILALDVGRYLASCKGKVPARILAVIEEQKGVSGTALLATSAGPPYGYAPDVVKACVAGLLRGRKIRIRPDSGDEMRTVNDPGVRDLFLEDRAFRRAVFLPGPGDVPTAKDLVAISKFFQEQLDVDVEQDREVIADAVYKHFPGQKERLRRVEARLLRLPGHPRLPATLERLARALEDCRRSRQAETTLVAVLHNLDPLRDGIEQLAILDAELTDASIEAIRIAHEVLHSQYEQLAALGGGADLEAEAAVLRGHLAGEHPWRSLPDVAGILEAIARGYTSRRRALLGSQEQEAEAARQRVKSRIGFERLDEDQVHRVLRPLALAVRDTSDEAIAPSLAQIRDGLPARLRAAEDEANELLDRDLERLDQQVVLKVPLSLRGREINDENQLEALVAEIRERVAPLLRDGKRARFV
jgi:hypothetical protein